ncbi:hemolysin family protein [Chondromyces apiculatus]|uniref:hemolysin family protein n=1 Tax=Chondromyces apiculatus TaxID=51 RepID=UPI001E2FAACF|nr:hemolysin family protein [Chondromyces apiculatus]
MTAVLGALFIGADTALNTLSTTRLGALIEQSSGATRSAYERIRRLEAKLRTRYLLGLIVTTTLTGVLFDGVFIGAFPRWSEAVAAAATTVLCGVLYAVSATLARRYADQAAAIAARFLVPLEIPLIVLAGPLAWLSEKLGPKEGEPPSDPRVTEAEVEMLVEEVEKSGLFGREPAEMIRNVLEFADLKALDVMIPRSRLEAIEVSTSIEKAVALVTESGHSRYPIYKDQIDNIVGLLYAKDLFKVVNERGETPKTLREVVRTPANFVAETQPLSSLLKEMRGRRQHLAIVVDEFGSVSGIVTLEDVLEEIVGDIRDEHDEGEDPAAIQDLGDGRLVADGEISMSDLSAYLGTEITADGDHESLGGMLTHHLGKVPEVGTSVSKWGLRFVIRDSDERHIGKVEIIRPRPASTNDAA